MSATLDSIRALADNIGVRITLPDPPPQPDPVEAPDAPKTEELPSLRWNKEDIERFDVTGRTDLLAHFMALVLQSGRWFHLQPVALSKALACRGDLTDRQVLEALSSLPARLRRDADPSQLLGEFNLALDAGTLAWLGAKSRLPLTVNVLDAVIDETISVGTCTFSDLVDLALHHGILLGGLLDIAKPGQLTGSQLKAVLAAEYLQGHVLHGRCPDTATPAIRIRAVAAVKLLGSKSRHRVALALRYGDLTFAQVVAAPAVDSAMMYLVRARFGDTPEVVDLVVRKSDTLAGAIQVLGKARTALVWELAKSHFSDEHLVAALACPTGPLMNELDPTRTRDARILAFVADAQTARGTGWGIVLYNPYVHARNARGVAQIVVPRIAGVVQHWEPARALPCDVVLLEHLQDVIGADGWLWDKVTDETSLFAKLTVAAAADIYRQRHTEAAARVAAKTQKA